MNTAFLDALFAPAPPGTFINVSGYAMNGDGYALDKNGSRIWTDKIGAYSVSEVGHLETPELDRWFTPHPRLKPERGSEENTAAVVAVFADFDFADSSDGKDPEQHPTVASAPPRASHRWHPRDRRSTPSPHRSGCPARSPQPPDRSTRSYSPGDQPRGPPTWLRWPSRSCCRCRSR